jgi:histidyl-tRNA synthetase
VKLHVGDRRVVEEYIKNSLKVASEEKALEMMRALDKVDKKTETELIKEYEAKGVTQTEMKRLLDFGRIKGAPHEVAKRLREEGLESAQGLAELDDILKTRGIRNVEYDLSIVRGIDYYTAIVFEVKDGARPDLGSLCGGGRYDALPRILGRPELSATGAAGGVERIALSLSRSEKHDERNSVYIAFTEPALGGEAAQLLAQVRALGVRADVGLRAKGLRKQLEDASTMGFRWVSIIGKKELESGRVLLKDLRDGSERLLTREEFLREVGSS